MTRIIPASGTTRGLVRVSDALEIAAEFYDAGYHSVLDLTLNVERSAYQCWRLIEERRDTALGCRMKFWEIDGEDIVITENGTRYTMKELEVLKGISDEDWKRLDAVKGMFDGIVVPEKKENSL
jgi:hypothetical protein